MADRLKGKVAIICGAGSSSGGINIGMATAILFASEGARVFAVDCDAALVAGTKKAIEDEGGDCTTHICDVADAQAVSGVGDACVARYGRVDILFNNVGIYALGGPLEATEEAFDRLMAINVKGMLFACRSVIPHMLAQGGGAIVNNCSVSAIRYSVPTMLYSMTKAAVRQVTQSVGLQYAPKGIRANSVLPGNIVTDRLTSRLKSTFGDAYVDKVREWGEQVPSGQGGEPWDVAYAVLYLASDEAKYVNGAELVVDGGLSASINGRMS